MVEETKNLQEGLREEMVYLCFTDDQGKIYINIPWTELQEEKIHSKSDKKKTFQKEIIGGKFTLIKIARK
jgi:hypothetical protein